MATVMRRTYHMIVVVGDSGVGKTSLLKQYICKEFSEEYRIRRTPDFWDKKFVDKDRLVTLHFWKTPGDYDPPPCVPTETECCVLVYDVNDKSSFDSLDSWREKVFDEWHGNQKFSSLPRLSHPKKFHFILIGNKIDIDGGNSRSVSEKSAQDWCAANGDIPYFETSAKEDYNLDAAFLSVAKDDEEDMFIEEETEEMEEEEVEEEEEDDDDDFDKIETEMEVFCFIKERIFHPTIVSFIQSEDREDQINKYLNKIEIFITTTLLKVQHAEYRSQIMSLMLKIASATKIFTKYLFKNKFKEESDKQIILSYFLESLASAMPKIRNHENTFQKTTQFAHKLINSITNSLHHVKNLEMALLDTEDYSRYCIPLNFESPELLVIKAFPDLIRRVKESFDTCMVNLISELSYQLTELLDNAKEIEMVCRHDPQSVLLVGGLLSFKKADGYTWNRVLRDFGSGGVLRDLGRYEIFSYCLENLPKPLKQRFIYLACYPKGYEIPMASVTKIWIAEGFITPEEGETREETVNKYLEQLIQRSLICVSMRSLSGTIKYFRVSRTIQNHVIRYLEGLTSTGTSQTEFLSVNPDRFTMESRCERVAIHNDDRNKYTEVKCISLRSFLVFGIDRNVLGSARFLRVLELRNSVLRETVLEKMPHLQYLGLRGSKISKLPENIGNMQNLRTLDVRDTNIQILPESLWNISSLCHVHVNPEPRIQGPPATANIPNLQILKTFEVPKSWLEKVAHLSINLRKLALSYSGHLELETISKPLSCTVNLLSIAIMGPIVHAELADTRAFPNLNTLKSIKLVGTWNFRKLPIDNVQFPTNLVKLILSNSRLKEDPMPALERLQVLKLLRLENGAYTGEKMVCSAHGFPHLQFLHLSKLANLEIWEVNPMAMPQLTTLRVVQCHKLKNRPHLEHVTDKEYI